MNLLEKAQERKEINRPITRRNVKAFYGKVEASRLGYVQCDLMDMAGYKKFNKGFGYALLFIDIRSRFGWAYPTKRKTASECAESLEKWYDFAVDNPSDLSLKKLWTLYTDDGGEFKGEFNKFLEKNSVKHVMTVSDTSHQVLVERWIRTLKEKIRESWLENDTLSAEGRRRSAFNWVDHIDKIVREYNDTIHSRMKERPNEVIRGLKEPRFDKPKPQTEASKLDVGDKVRIALVKDRFEKSTLKNNYSSTLYTVEEVSGNVYLLSNGLKYPRWKLLKSGIAGVLPKEPKKPIEDRQQDLRKKKKVVRALTKEGVEQKNIRRKVRPRPS